MLVGNQLNATSELSGFPGKSGGTVALSAIAYPCLLFSLSLQHIQDPWLLSAYNVERERSVNTILSLLQTFRDNMLLTVGGVSSKVCLNSYLCIERVVLLS